MTPQLPVTTRSHTHADEVTPRNRDHSDRLKVAMQRCGVQAKEVAFWWSCSHVFVSLVLSGEKSLTGDRIELLRRDVKEEMARLWCDDLDLLCGSRAAAIGALQAGLHLLALDAVPMKMARAELSAPAAEPKKKRA